MRTMQRQRMTNHPSMLSFHYLHLLLCFLAYAVPCLGPASASASPSMTNIHIPYTATPDAVDAQTNIFACRALENYGGLRAFFSGDERTGKTPPQLAGAAGLGETAPDAAGGEVITEGPLAVARSGAHSMWMRQRRGDAAAWRAAAAAALAAVAVAYLLLLCFRKISERSAEVKSRMLANETQYGNDRNSCFDSDEDEGEVNSTETGANKSRTHDGRIVDDHENKPSQQVPEPSPVATSQADEKDDDQVSLENVSHTSEDDLIKFDKDDVEGFETGPALGQTLDRSDRVIDNNPSHGQVADLGDLLEFLDSVENDVEIPAAYSTVLGSRESTRQRNHGFAESVSNWGLELHNMTSTIHDAPETSTHDGEANRSDYQKQMREDASARNSGIPTAVEEAQDIHIGMYALGGSHVKNALSRRVSTGSTLVGRGSSILNRTRAGSGYGATAEAAETTDRSKSSSQSYTSCQEDTTVHFDHFSEVDQTFSTVSQQLRQECLEPLPRYIAYASAVSVLIFIGLIFTYQESWAYAGIGVSLLAFVISIATSIWQARRRLNHPHSRLRESESR